jgi:hypothetical protein
MVLFSDNISSMLFEYRKYHEKIDPAKVDEVAEALHRIEKSMEAHLLAITKILEIQLDEFHARTGK